MTRRIVVPADVLCVMSPGDVVLGRRESHYVRNVLRLDRGDDVVLMDGLGMFAHGKVREWQGDQAIVYLSEFGQSTAHESPLRITLLVGLPRGQRWDFALQKATELGVHRIWPVYTKRTELRIPEDRLDDRLDRWERIAAEAARQCGRSEAPQIGAPDKLEAALDLLSYERDVDLQIVAWEAAHNHPANTDIEILLSGSTARNVVLLVGPEGGLETSEVDLCTKHGFHAVSLGPRTLRCETAVIVLTTLVQYRLGDLS